MTRSTLYVILDILDRNHLPYSISRHRDDTVLLSITLVGKRIEIDIFEDDHIEYSVFSGDESVSSDFDELLKILDVKQC
jgi:hypothetical protein